MISIRPESTVDYDSIRAITIEAFTHSDLGHNGEAELAESLRNNCPSTLSLVACDDDVLIGHIMLTPVVITHMSGDILGMGVAPMSVLSSHQRMGVGTALLSSALDRLATIKNPFTVVVGHPNYYPRFGFVSAKQFGISHGFNGMPQELFFVFTDAPDTLCAVRGGNAYYRPEFGPQHISS